MSRRKYPEHVIFQNRMFDFDIENAISSQDCTGLIPSAPKTEAEFESYNDIINYSPRSANIYYHNS